MATSKTVTPLAPGLQTVDFRLVREHEVLKAAQRPLNSDHVDALLASIKRNGLDTPLLVWNGGAEEGIMQIKDKEYPSCFLVAGNHRRQALKRFMKEDPEAFASKFPDGVPVKVIEGKDPDTQTTLADAVAAQLRENLLRENITVKESLNAVEYLVNTAKMKQKAIAAAVGKSEAWVSSVLDIKEQLGDEAVEDLKNDKITMREALEAASTVKKDKKAGKSVDPKATVAKVAAKRATLKAAGRERADKRVSAKVIYSRYTSLPAMAMGKKIGILEAALAYLAGAEDGEIPSELSAETGD